MMKKKYGQEKWGAMMKKFGHEKWGAREGGGG